MDFLIIAILAAVLGGAGYAIYRAKKSGHMHRLPLRRRLRRMQRKLRQLNKKKSPEFSGDFLHIVK